MTEADTKLLERLRDLADEIDYANSLARVLDRELDDHRLHNHMSAHDAAHFLHEAHREAVKQRRDFLNALEKHDNKVEESTP